MSRIILFLDCDGVLNRSSTKERLPSGHMGIDAELAARLARILEAHPSVEIVIASTWRRSRTHWFEIWKGIGLHYKERWGGNTPVMDNKLDSGIWLAATRADEIREWLRANEDVTDYIILDDDTSIRAIPELVPHWIQTDSYAGLSDADADRAIRLLTPRK